MIAYLICMRCAHKNDWPFLGNLPATPRVHLSEEEFNQDGEDPQKPIVEIFVHGRELVAL